MEATTPITLQQQAQITLNCIYEKIARYILKSCCCEDCKDKSFWKYRYFNLIGKVLQCDTTYTYLTDEQIYQMMSTTDCKGCIPITVLPEPEPPSLQEECYYVLPDYDTEISVQVNDGAPVTVVFNGINDPNFQVFMFMLNTIAPGILEFVVEDTGLFLTLKVYRTDGYTVNVDMGSIDYGTECGEIVDFDIITSEEDEFIQTEDDINIRLET